MTHELNHKGSKVYWALLQKVASNNKILFMKPLTGENEYLTYFKKKAELFIIWKTVLFD